ncbi:hypothetical protein V1478_013225 [Vespula squamosa]|uniref:Uncharacterized protein n=1 Tax=Vespula squamosa TaxID=30214 RepID=A0ABD2AAD7_VESSQ
MNSRSEADSTLTVKRSFVLHREVLLACVPRTRRKTVVRKPRVVLLSSDLREEDEEDKEEEEEEEDSNEKNHQGRGIVKTKVAKISLLVFS